MYMIWFNWVLWNINHFILKKQKVCSLSLCYRHMETRRKKDTRGVTCFMEENEISLSEVARFDEYKRD